MSVSEVDYLALLTDEVAKPPDVGACAPHFFDALTCFATCASNWDHGRACLLRTLDRWSCNAVLEDTTLPHLTIPNVLIALPFVERVLQRYGYSATIQQHKTEASGSHNRSEVRFVINHRRNKAGWGGYVYHGAERNAGVPRLYRTVIKFDKEHSVKIHLLRFVVQIISAAYLQGSPPEESRRCVIRAQIFGKPTFFWLTSL